MWKELIGKAAQVAAKAGQAAGKAAQAVGKAAVDHLIRYDAPQRTLRVADSVVVGAAKAAVARSERPVEVEITPGVSGYAFRLTTQDGLIIQATLCPQHLSLHGDHLLFQAALPGGVRSSHTGALRNFLVRWFDQLFGISAKALKRLDGVELAGETLTYTRPLEGTVLGRALAPLRAPDGSPVRIDLAVEDGWLRLDLPKAGEQITLNWAPLVTLAASLVVNRAKTQTPADGPEPPPA